MKRPISVAESYHHARRIARGASSNFYRSFWLLPRRKREAMDALYAFARITDDVGDCHAPTDRRELWLRWWRHATATYLRNGDPSADPFDSGIPIPSDVSPPPARQNRRGLGGRFRNASIDMARSAHQVLPALCDASQQFGIPQQHLLEIIDGVLADQRKTRFDTYEQLEHYCYLVATAVGLCCLYIWEFEPPLPLAAAIDCGVAFQLTNILRDVREDAARGRIYLPRQHWRQHGLCEDDLLDPRPDARFRCLIEDEISRAVGLYKSGWQVWDRVHPDGQPMFSMIWRTYHRLLDRIAESPTAVARTRVQLPVGDRLDIASRHFFPFLFRRLPLPPLELQR